MKWQLVVPSPIKATHPATIKFIITIGCSAALVSASVFASLAFSRERLVTKSRPVLGRLF